MTSVAKKSFFTEYNWYLPKIQIPLLLTLVFIVYQVGFNSLKLDWHIIFFWWFLIGPVGVGVGYHRLLSHRQFSTHPSVEKLLVLLGTLSAYAPALFFISHHQYHHQHSDEISDISSPRRHGLLKTFFLSRLTVEATRCVEIKSYCSRVALKDPFIRNMSRHFVLIVWLFAILVFLIGGIKALAQFLIIPALLEHTRINIVSSLSHVNLPLSYKNHSTQDDSFNNFFLGLVTFGFGWHNNHHNNERKMLLQEKWWEIDIEGYLAWFISLLKFSGIARNEQDAHAVSDKES
jgi:fatty-acid desaturase